VEKQKVTDRANHDIAEIRRVATFRLNQLAADTRATIRELNAQITVHQTAADKMVDIWKRALTNIKGFVRAEVKVTYFQAPSGSNAPESGAGLANDKEGRTTAGSAPTSSGPASFGQVADALRSGAPTRLASDGSVEVFLNGQWRTTGQRPGDAIPGGGTVPTPRAGGGPVKARDLYLVGERGRPELFVPDQDGHIIDDVKTAALLGGSAGRGFDIPEPSLVRGAIR
jgi:hypothetical protein